MKKLVQNISITNSESIFLKKKTLSFAEACSRLISKNPLLTCIVTAFIMMSWPFVYYPLTDGDVAHWIKVANHVRINNLFLTSINDQTHGPILSWASGIITKIAPHSFYSYALWDIVLGLFGIWLIYFFSYKIWHNRKIARLNAVILSSSLAYIYLIRTPMYDFTSAIFYFAFAGMYLLYILEKDETNRYFLLSLLFVGLGSLSRFSICLGLAEIYMVLVSLAYKRKFTLIIRDGFLIFLLPLLFNLPWIIGQTHVYGNKFLSDFFYDNFGRYIKEPGTKSEINKDFYAFPLYVIVGMLPFTSLLVASFFRKTFLQRIRQQKVYQALVAGFLPGLIIFSLSGHPKLGRYISFVFPFVSMLLGHTLYIYDLRDKKLLKKVGWITLIIMILIAIIFLVVIKHFLFEAQEGSLLTVGLITLVFSMLAVMYYVIKYKPDLLTKKPETILFPIALLYMGFFTILTYETLHVGFLLAIRQEILSIIK
ncbi:MAG: hypothetical protein DKM50_00695 [Candidatus Margulisiibacteriota bacterium]|nr:MAG: hypothetical protein DKM50_00695 [Candidatus Margulisiibacteriota bacterium]HCT85219.1 hypothetical protein [Candidatus Margulisiibacteriota bacterium]HCY36351.1 hypothetical protein [Candidatus Margulisiibacteriota bacterium]